MSIPIAKNYRPSSYEPKKNNGNESGIRRGNTGSAGNSGARSGVTKGNRWKTIVAAARRGCKPLLNVK